MNRLRLLVLCAALAIAGCGGEERDAAEATNSPVVDAGSRRVTLPPDSPLLDELEVARVEAADFPSVEVVAPGRLRAEPTRLARVTSPVKGKIARVLVAQGDSVEQGAPLVELESSEASGFESDELQARAAVDQTRSELAKADADRERMRDLFAHNAVARKEVLNAETEYDRAAAALIQAKAALAQTSRRLRILGLESDHFDQPLIVRAPLAGKVLDLAVAAGVFLDDTSGPLMTVADLSVLWVTSSVPEADVSKIHVGENLEVSLTAHPERIFSATVTHVADAVDPDSHTVEVRGELQNPDGLLRPEMFGQIRHIDALASIPVLPVDAILQSEGEPYVYLVISPGVFEPKPVELGVRREGRVGVLRGVAVGDAVVVDGAVLLAGY
jgi:membrane fusion protein, heavy metal efflux system